jgi:hypothetical protein
VVLGGILDAFMLVRLILYQNSVLNRGQDVLGIIKFRWHRNEKLLRNPALLLFRLSEMHVCLIFAVFVASTLLIVDYVADDVL